MTVLNVAMFGSDELAKDVAKATDQRDVHTYVHKELTNGEAKIISIIRFETSNLLGELKVNVCRIFRIARL